VTKTRRTVRILTLVQGIYGQRITAHLRQHAVDGWQVASWLLPPVLPPVIDYPEEYLPATLPEADLVLSLGEHPGVAELLPDAARLCGARAAIVPVDNVAWLPPGLMNQLAGWLAGMGIPVVFPKPFCSLTETTYNAYRSQVAYDIPLVSEFARHFGKPVFVLEVDASGATVAQVRVLRDTPCGCARHVADGLAGVAVDEAEQVAGMRHHHYPCLAAMVIDPDYNDTLMHISGRILKDEIADQVQPYRRAPLYLRPTGRSE
jgi:hypothetical protein